MRKEKTDKTNRNCTISSTLNRYYQNINTTSFIKNKSIKTQTKDKLNKKTKTICRFTHLVVSFSVIEQVVFRICFSKKIVP